MDRRALLFAGAAAAGLTAAIPLSATAQAGTTLKSMTWLFDTNPIAGLSAFVATATGAQLAATQVQPDQSQPGYVAPYFDLELPPGFPDPCLIHATRILCGNSGLTNAGEIDLWVDPGGAYFTGSHPPGQETSPASKMANIIRLNRMGSVPPVYSPDQYQDLPLPVSFSRTANDMLVLYVIPQTIFDWVGLDLYFE
jgi:hypothetical protein